MVPLLQPPSLNTMIFLTGRHHGQDVVLATLLATLPPPKGSRSINMSWAIPPWLALVEFLGLTAKEYNKHDNDKATMSTMTATTATTGTTATATAAMPTTRMAVTMATTTKVTWTAMGDGDDDYNNDDVDNNNNGDGTTMMQWRRRRWNDNDLMAMG